MSTLYILTWDDGVYKLPLGFMTEDVLKKLIKTPTSVKGELEVRRGQREVCVFQEDTEEERSKRAAATAAYWRENKEFRVLEGWRDELYPVYGPHDQLLYSVERTAAALFGIVTYGAHMMAYVKDPEASHGIKLWVPRRSYGKHTYAGMLDNTVAGGMATGEDPLECIIREAEEEASLPDEVVRKNVTAHGTVTYIYMRNELATGEVGLIQPEVQYVFDLELPIDIIPKPNDSEVECFYLWTVEEVQRNMAMGAFKPNTTLLMLDFFIRHGILTPENEKDFDEIKIRLHRPLDFPGPHGARP
jgi:8-oxo-dGTP pyrophosphatase MutT (NUDIX family)